ncbi:MAG TPA: hypothetical protein VNO81_00580, partial [Candidatus Nitrosotenuis sp.]|nr:hypothetical protein [Candidatus Nitrosotenuis sp.]
MKILAPALLAISLALALLLTGCTSSSGTDEVPAQDVVAPTTEANFDVITASAESDLSGVPVPNSLLLQDPVTGFVDIPGDGEPFDSWNSIQGFSVSGHILVPFVGQVNPGSVDANPLDGGSLSVIVFDTDNNQVVPCFSRVSNDSEGNSTVDLWPVRPMQPGATHLVIVTNAVEDTSGNPVGSVDQFELMKLQTPLVVDGVSQVSWLSSSTAEALEPLRQAYDQLIWPGAELIAGTSRDNIPMAFPLTTQPVSASSGLFTTLQQLEQRSHANPPTPTITAAFVGAAQVNAFYAAIGQSSVPHSNIGAIFIGSFPATQYVSDPLDGPFTYDANGQVQVATGPWAQARTTQGFICFLPAVDMQFPTVIFQHGITRTYLDSVALADGACSVGLGVIAINAALHGLSPNPNPAVFVGQNNIPGQASGTGFINLSVP